MVGKEGYQLAFVIDGNSFRLPEVDLFSLPEIKFFLEAVGKRPLGQNLLHPNLLLVDLRHKQSLIFDGSNWRQEPTDEIKKKKGGFGAVLIVSPALNQETIPEFGKRLKKAGDFLPKHQGVVFILEEKGQDTDPKSRKKTLRDAGLTKANILRPRNQKYLIWEGRKPKEHRGVNLTRFDDFWLTLRVVCQQYLEAGFEVVVYDQEKATTTPLLPLLAQLQNDFAGDHEINLPIPEAISRCLSSANPPDSVSRMISGFGLTLKNQTCGCVWQIDWQGSPTKIIDCGDKDCEQTLPLEIKPPRRYRIGFYQSNYVCDRCAVWQQADDSGREFFEIGPKLNCQTNITKQTLFRAKILIKYDCPGCDYQYKQTCWVLKAEIV